MKTDALSALKRIVFLPKKDVPPRRILPPGMVYDMMGNEVKDPNRPVRYNMMGQEV